MAATSMSRAIPYDDVRATIQPREPSGSILLVELILNERAVWLMAGMKWVLVWIRLG